MPHLAAVLLLAVGAATAAAAPSADLAPGRAKELKVNLKSFQLELSYNGPEDKPFYRLVLSVPPIGDDRSNPFYRAIQIGEAQAGKLIDRLAQDGFLAHALEQPKRPQPTTPGYTLTVGNLYEDLGWGLPMLKRLDGLRQVLDGDAAKAMDLLLARLSGLRQQWEKADAAQPPADGWKNLYADEPWYKDYQKPEQVFVGTLQRHKEPAVSTLMRSHRYQLGDRFLYPGKEHPELEKMVGQPVEVRGKPYDIALEGQAVSEIWPAAIRRQPTAATVPPHQPPKVQDVAAALGGKLYPKCIWVDGVYVDLHDQPVTDAGLQRLAGFTEIKGLNLVGTRVTDAGLKQIAGLINLRRLELNKTRLTDAGLAHLQALPHLEKLFLADTAISDAGLPRLKGLPKLTLLDLSGTQLTAAGLAGIKDLPHLNTLYLNRRQLTEPLLDRLKQLPQITTLGVYQPGDNGVADLKQALPHCTIQPLP